MRKLIASLAAMLSASLTMSGCQTADLRPIIYKPVPTGRTGKVPESVKTETRAKREPAKSTAPKPEQPSKIYTRPPRSNEYGQPL